MKTVWPAQIGIYIAAIIALYLIFKPGRSSNKVISGILALFWMWMGIVYHWRFFTQINPVAYFFGVLFLFQGLIFIFDGIVRNNLKFSFSKNLRSATGLILIFFGSVITPILGHFLGHNYLGSPTFGFPCPITIFTLGVLLLADRPPRYVAIIPLLVGNRFFSCDISGSKRRCIFANSWFDRNKFYPVQKARSNLQKRNWEF